MREKIDDMKKAIDDLEYIMELANAYIGCNHKSKETLNKIERIFNKRVKMYVSEFIKTQNIGDSYND